MGLSRKLYELFRRANQVEEFPQWVALDVFDKGAPMPALPMESASDRASHPSAMPTKRQPRCEIHPCGVCPTAHQTERDDAA